MHIDVNLADCDKNGYLVNVIVVSEPISEERIYAAQIAEWSVPVGQWGHFREIVYCGSFLDSLYAIEHSL